MNVCLTSEAVQYCINEIFRPYYHYKKGLDVSFTEMEASSLWFEIFGLQRLIHSFELGVLLWESQRYDDFCEIKRMVANALLQADQVYNELKNSSRK